MKRSLIFFVLALALIRRANAQLETRGAVSVPIQPLSVAVGDFDHDGTTDLAIASAGSFTEQLSVLLGNGDGTFRVAGNYSVGDGDLESITAADFNGDGNLDLAVVQYLNATVSVLMGNGDGTFQPSADYPTPSHPILVGAADFNGDKHPDLAVLESFDSCRCVSVLLNNGDGTFGLAQNTEIPFPFATAMGIGDFNHDGIPDIAAAGSFETTAALQIFLGNGDGSFATGSTYDLPSEALGVGTIAVADLRRTGKLDLVVTNFLSEVRVFLGNGDGTFQPYVEYPATWPAVAAVADINGDGKPDIVVSGEGVTRDTNGVNTLLGNGDGTFQSAQFFQAGDEAFGLGVGDFNGDRKVDVAVADHLYSYVTTLLNTGAVVFSPSTPLLFPFQLTGTTSPSQAITLTNNGTSSLTISSMGVQGQFAMNSTCGKSVAAGGTCRINVTFSPQSRGIKAGAISIHDSASSQPQVIELSGVGSVVALSPTSLAFGSQKVGTRSAPQTVTLTNQGSFALIMGTISIGGANYRDFQETNNCPASLTAGADCKITVTFDPQRSGSRSAAVKITDNGGGGSAQTVPLGGTGS